MNLKTKQMKDKIRKERIIMNKNDKLEFYGGKAMSLIPLLIFVVFCVLFFVVFKVFEMEGLAMGGILAIIIGSIFSKNWTKYWEAVVKGM